MNDSGNPHVGIEALLTPQNSVLLLIDHQPFQFANLHSHEPTLIVASLLPGRCSFSVALQKRREQTSARSRYRTITRRHHS